jgi:hypothetical protein
LDFHAPLPADFVKVEKALRKMATAAVRKPATAAAAAGAPRPQGYSKNPPVRRLGRHTEE